MKIERLFFVFSAGLLLLIATQAYAVPANGLMTEYLFNGDAIDSSGNGNHGIASNATLATDRFGNNNSAYGFDGLNDSIYAMDDSSLDITNQITLAAWVNPGIRKTQYILNKGAAVNGPLAAPYSLGLSGSGDIVFSLRPDLNFTQARAHGYSLNEWSFITGTYDGANMKLYVNGVMEDLISVAGVLNQNDQGLLIGVRLGLLSDSFNGQLDDIRIYDRSLSETEIWELYNLPEPVPEPSTMLLLGSGLAGLAWYRRKRK